MSVNYHLAYFNGKGLAEVSRLVFAATETPFEDFRYPFQIIDGNYIKPEFDSIKDTLPMGQVPLLTVKKNDQVILKLSQSKAIERYIASKTGLMGSSPEEAALIDSICELVIDLKTKFNSAKSDHVLTTKFFEEVLPLNLSFVEKFIAASGSGFCIGKQISLADIQLFHFLTIFIPAENKVTERVSEVIAMLLTQVLSIPGIAKWEEGRSTRGDAF